MCMPIIIITRVICRGCANKLQIVTLLLLIFSPRSNRLPFSFAFRIILQRTFLCFPWRVLCLSVSLIGGRSQLFHTYCGHTHIRVSINDSLDQSIDPLQNYWNLCEMHTILYGLFVCWGVFYSLVSIFHDAHEPYLDTLHKFSQAKTPRISQQCKYCKQHHIK